MSRELTPEEAVWLYNLKDVLDHKPESIRLSVYDGYATYEEPYMDVYVDGAQNPSARVERFIIK